MPKIFGPNFIVKIPAIFDLAILTRNSNLWSPDLYPAGSFCCVPLKRIRNNMYCFCFYMLAHERSPLIRDFWNKRRVSSVVVCRVRNWKVLSPNPGISKSIFLRSHSKCKPYLMVTSYPINKMWNFKSGISNQKSI